MPATRTASDLALDLPTGGSPNGRRVLAAILDLGRAALDRMTVCATDFGRPFAALGHLRGTGPGVAFSDLGATLEHEHPLQLTYPCEGSDRVGGAGWRGDELLSPDRDDALAKLRWESGADDLPMHVHTRSERFIIVLEGRGFFHVSRQDYEAFDGSDVQTIAARERDVFLFTRDVVHTFSTAEHAMTLLSCQLPFIPFEDPTQYALPAHRWTAASGLRHRTPQVICTAGWSKLV